MRIPPQYRMNIRNILKELELDKYDEWELFKKYSGKSVRDGDYIERIE